MDVPVDPYECERCRWDWRTRTFASFCKEHQRRAAEQRPVSRLYDLIPPASEPLDPPEAPSQSPTKPDRAPAKTATRRVEFDL
jgi:hypothetical protein